VDIEVRSLVKRYGEVTAVDGLDLHARAGVVTGFLGRNGAGKTTTLRILLGLVRPTVGQATLDGKAYHELDQPARHVGAILDGSGFHPGRTARDHLRILAAAAGLSTERVTPMLSLVGLREVGDRRVGQFSLGMRQRLQLAAALLGDPQALVLDEPANGLDPEGIAWLRGLLREFARAGGTVLVSSHVLAEMEQLADEVVIIDRGRLVASGAVPVLLARAAGGFRVRSGDPQRLARALREQGAQVELAGDGRSAPEEPLEGPSEVPSEEHGLPPGGQVSGPPLLVSGVSAQLVGDLALREAIPLYELTATTTTLEDVFFQVTHANGEAGGSR
jgi:ABC-2 type transport system ATP-binding protein